MRSNKKILVALVGNQNAGKTSLFNKLVGARQEVGNWPGVTVEKYEGKLKFQDYEITIVDLPGIYSLIPYTPEETITRNYLIKNAPDIIINVVDTTNLYRNLYLSTQLMELQKPMLIALNIYDEIENAGISINVPELAKLLNIKLIPVSSKLNLGFAELLPAVLDLFNQKNSLANYKIEHYDDVELYLEKLEQIIRKDEQLNKTYSTRWIALKLLERSAEITKVMGNSKVWRELSPEVDAALLFLEKHFEQDILTTLVESRYAFIRGAIKETVEHLPKNKKTLTEIIDDVLINRVIGLPIFFFFLWLIFHLTFSLGEIPMRWLEFLFAGAKTIATAFLPAGILRSLIVDGIISGVGGVLVFVPNILILFVGIAILEATGYMARAAFVVDRAMHKIGLHGRSFIPLILGFGCTVPAIMACRTLKNRADRLTTMLILPFMSCSAKLPVYVLLIGAFFPKNNSGNVLFAIYLAGAVVAMVMAKILKTIIFKGESEPFVMELPPYRLPSVKSIFLHAWEKTSMYIKKAGTVILFFAIVIWFISNFPGTTAMSKNIDSPVSLIQIDRSLGERQNQVTNITNQNLPENSRLYNSYAGALGRFIEPAIKPLGFNWQIGVALISGFAAKEVIVSTLGTIYSLSDDTKGLNQHSLEDRLRNSPGFSPLTAISLIIFVMLYVPCMAATAVFHKEAGSWRWTWFYIIYTTGLAYLASLIFFQVGRLFW